ncbi:hypothetical protein [Agrococcus sp. BE272]|uniref:hypothetical protein n=1 Tax=Agrococcus sp. BE272 TaxID=2817727 RepID=UPI00285D32AA|nr:hypothetical protein [Agrococcus sp. BE272]MDR7232887.1 hypothetical protein [Agrococcus sp. BE272]
MKSTRILAFPAIAAASLLALTGCFQLPPMGGGTTTETQAPAPSGDGGDTGSASVDLADTAWSGEDAAGNTMDLVLEGDGTVLLNDWNGQNWDEAGDTWEVAGDQITIFIGGIENIQSLTYTGTAQLETMELTGVDGNGDSGYDVTLTQG